MKARIKRKIQKRPYLYNVGQVFKACDYLTIGIGIVHPVLLLNVMFKGGR